MCTIMYQLFNMRTDQIFLISAIGGLQKWEWDKFPFQIQLPKSILKSTKQMIKSVCTIYVPFSSNKFTKMDKLCNWICLCLKVLVVFFPKLLEASDCVWMRFFRSDNRFILIKSHKLYIFSSNNEMQIWVGHVLNGLNRWARIWCPKTSKIPIFHRLTRSFLAFMLSAQ